MFLKNILILIFLINLFLISSNSDCEKTIPSKPDDCTSINVSDSMQYPDYCCYYQSVDNNNNKNPFCRTIPYSSYYQEESYENINDELYKVTCKGKGKKATLLEQCGNVNKASETEFDDCKEHSTLVNSCCFTNGYANIPKGCYWLGSKYEGEVTWAGVDLECNMNYLKYSLFYLIFIFLFLF